jgi:ABC-2 type transport system permease protein
MSARPGSALWLLKHELRLFWLNSAVSGKGAPAKRGLSKRAIARWIGLWLIFHAGAFVLLRELRGPVWELPPPLLLGLTVIMACLFMFMLSSGLKSSVEALFDRGDLDLLLSSPLPSRSIFTVRLLAMVVAVGAWYLFFLAPFANVGLALGQFRWLGIYPTIVGAAAVASSFAMLLTLGLVRLLGARRTRVLAQIIGALSGAAIFLMSQAFNFASRSQKAQAEQLFAQWLAPGNALAPGSFWWLPAKAVLGSPLPLLGMTLFAVGVLAVTVYSTHRFFVHGLQQAASMVSVAAAPVGGVRYQFGRSLSHTMLVKEWRLIARDPHLISQILLQLLYLLPLMVLVFSNDGVRLPAVATGMTMLGGSLAASLAWLVIQAEEAPDLLLLSPANAGVMRFAKLAAAAMPPLALVCGPLLWMVAHQPLPGLLTCFTVVGAVTSGCLVVMWSGRPGERGKFAKRGAGNLASNLLEATSSLAWSGLSYLLLNSLAGTPSTWAALGAGALFIVTIAVPLFAWLSGGRRAA